jgi:hypothetical protein
MSTDWKDDLAQKYRLVEEAMSGDQFKEVREFIKDYKRTTLKRALRLNITPLKNLTVWIHDDGKWTRLPAKRMEELFPSTGDAETQLKSNFFNIGQRQYKSLLNALTGVTKMGIDGIYRHKHADQFALLAHIPFNIKAHKILTSLMGLGFGLGTGVGTLLFEKYMLDKAYGSEQLFREKIDPLASAYDVEKMDKALWKRFQATYNADAPIFSVDDSELELQYHTMRVLKYIMENRGVLSTIESYT